MITKETAQTLGYGTTLHCCIKHECSKTVGPRGGITENITRVRVSGSCKTWKTRPNEYHLPIKWGLRESYWIDEDNNRSFHLPSECEVSQF